MSVKHLAYTELAKKANTTVVKTIAETSALQIQFDSKAQESVDVIRWPVNIKALIGMQRAHSEICCPQT